MPQKFFIDTLKIFARNRIKVDVVGVCICGRNNVKYALCKYYKKYEIIES